MQVTIVAQASQTFLPLYMVAEEYGDQVGLDVQFEFRNSGGDVLAAVATGQADAGGLGIGASVYNAVHEGLPIRLASPLTYTHNEDFLVISSRWVGNAEEATALWEDATPLEGATFAITARGTGTHGTVRIMLDRAGMTEDDVQIEAITPFSAMVQAMDQGAIDVGVIIDPFATSAEQEGIGFRPTRPSHDPDYMNSGMVINSDWAEANPEAAEALLEALHLAAADIEENGWYSEKNLAYILEYTGTDDAEAMAAGRPPVLYGDLRVDEVHESNYQADLIDANEVLFSEPIPFEDVWELKWRDAALQR